MSSNINMVCFNRSVPISTKNGIKNENVLHSDRFSLEIKANNLIVTKDDLVTIVPLVNVASVIMEAPTSV